MSATTYVLILLLTGKAVATIPGYPSLDACQNAAQAAFSQGLAGSDGIPTVIAHLCVPGPGALPAAPGK
jgi:hypothetical protein